ncbi:MAG: tetratricopeptide repeat protein [Bacteroidia bacterium]|nr:tetratricopeptide repeat protein [Bacteroidia bacterium]
MAKKLTRKEKLNLEKEQGKIGKPGKAETKEAEIRLKLKLRLGLLLALLAIGLYSNTFKNQYVLDDFGVISENTQTRKGIRAIPDIFSSSYRTGMNITDYSLYRPLSKALFAIEWEIAPGNPAVGHIMNVLWFAGLCLLMFHTISVMMKGKLLVPFITTALFAAHPLHTEVVANIKGRDEIVCLFFCLLTLLFTFQWILSGKKKHFLLLVPSFFLALLTKESAITWLAIVPLALYFFSDAPRAVYFRSTGALVAVTLIFLLIRRKVLGDVETGIPVVDNHLVAIGGFFLQRANAVYILGIYMYKLVYPFPLMADASYNHFAPVGFSDPEFLVPLIIILALLVFAAMGLKRKSLLSFGIMYFFITASIVSNVIILIGTNYGERLMFMPSMGFCFCTAVLLSRLAKKEPRDYLIPATGFFKATVRPLSLTVLAVLYFGIRTMGRNTDWYDNNSLYFTDVKTVPESAHLRFYIGNHITSEDQLDMLPDSTAKREKMYEGIRQLTKAIEIYPKYADAYQRRGYIEYLLKDFAAADSDYVTSLFYNPTQPVTHNNFGTLLFDTRRYGEALQHFKMALQYNPLYAHAANNVASVYGVMGEGERELAGKDPARAEEHLQKAKTSFETAISYYKKAIEIDPEYAEPYHLLAVTYKNTGDVTRADHFERQAVILQRQKQNAHH